MNCCNSYGHCTQDENCCIRDTPQDKAGRRFWCEPEYLGFIDAPGNAWDRSPWYGKALIVLAAVLACALVALLVVPK